jgi:hypothetical protein
MNDTAAAVRNSLAGVPDLGYKPVPDVFKLPPGLNFGPCSSVAVTSKGNLLVSSQRARTDGVRRQGQVPQLAQTFKIA